MKHLGGVGFDKRMFELSVVPGVLPEGYSLVDGHPGTKGSEELQVKIASSAAICHMGSVLMD